MPNIAEFDRAQARGLLEPQRQNNFHVQIHLDDTRGTRDILLALESTQLPQLTVEEIELRYLNFASYVAGSASYEQIPLVVKDLVDREVAAALVRWQDLVVNPRTGAVGLASSYKRQVDLILFAPDGSLERTWKLVGCWPVVNNPGALDMTASDKVNFECTLRFDRAYPDFT